MAKALTVAGSDSGGGAGIQADLKSFAALGVYGASVITAITAQNTVGVTAVHDVPPDVISMQFDAVMEDIGADAVKTGMLSSSAIIEVVADRIREHGVVNLVVDPVMVAKSGDPLLQPEAVSTLRDVLLPLALVATPNLPEAEALLGRRIETEEDIRRAAEAIHSLGARSVVIKGGHRSGDANDVFYDGSQFEEFPAPRIPTENTHGTGCTFASAIAAGLAKGISPRDAVAEAKEYVTGAIRESYSIGRGHSPVHHFYRSWQTVDIS